MAVFNRRFGLLLILVWVALWASGCSYFVDATQPNNSLGLGSPVTATQTVGQTFVARHGGLNGVSVLMAVDGPAGDGAAILHLRANPTAQQDIAQSRLPLSRVSGPGFYEFSFPAIRDTHGQRYYFVIEALGLPDGSSLVVGRGPGQTYDDGAMYRSGQPRDRQLTFRLHYAWGALIVGLLLGALADLQVVVVALALFVLPGYALLTYLLPEGKYAWGEKLGLAAGLSLCVYPLLTLWARVIGVQPGAATAWGPVIAASLALAWHYRRAFRARPAQVYSVLRGWARSAACLPDVTWLLMAALVLGVRLFVIRGYQVPFWGDSIQHAAIGQLMVDHGGLFDSWMPYAPFRTLTVHFGFHSDIAVVHWLMGDSIPRNTLVTGQIVNFLAILTLVPLANRLLQSRWAGVGTLLVAGLLSTMPMEYVNWGRYSQLAGQAVLPVAAWLTWQLAEVKARQWCAVLLTAIALAGMFLSYYRMPHYYAAFVVVWLAAYALPRWRLDWRSWGRWAVQIVAVGLVMLMLLAPWLAHIASGNLVASVEAGITSGSTWEQVRSEYEQWRGIALYVSPLLMVLAGGGLAWGLTQRGRRMGVATIGLWAVGLAALTATRLIRLPGSNHMASFAIMIGLYMPIGLLGGYLIDSVLHNLEPLLKAWAKVVAVGGLFIVMLWGIRERSAVIKHAYRLVSPADMAATDWIRTNTPSDARFLVDGFLIYNGQSAVGSDAGWWIPLLAGRQNTMPPQYALLNEKPNQPGYDKAVTNLVAELRRAGVTSPEGIRLLCQYGVTHVYVGQGQGQIALPPPEPMLPLSKLEASPHFATLYRQDKVGVFAFDTSVCP